jgi:hypothetical protein
MNERVQYIVSQVRMNLSEISQANIQTLDIIYRANQVQNNILLETKCVEKDFEIFLLTGQQSYDFEDENTLDIKEVFSSWGGEIQYIPNNRWRGYKDLTGSRPCYMTVFANKVHFAPVPVTDTDSVTVWAYQTSYEDAITEQNEPEIPKFCDDAIIAGVCAHYDPKNWKEEYRDLVRLINRRVHQKVSKHKETNLEW